MVLALSLLDRTPTPRAVHRAAAARHPGWRTRWLEQHFEIRPGSGTVEPFVDGLRALAVLSVITLHAWGLAGGRHLRPFGLDITWWPQTLGLGVNVLFVLSGFLLARPWFVRLFPSRTEISYASGRAIVTLVVSARTTGAVDAGADAVLRQAIAVYPPTA